MRDANGASAGPPGPLNPTRSAKPKHTRQGHAPRTACSEPVTRRLDPASRGAQPAVRGAPSATLSRAGRAGSSDAAHLAVRRDSYHRASGSGHWPLRDSGRGILSSGKTQASVDEPKAHIASRQKSIIADRRMRAHACARRVHSKIVGGLPDNINE